MVKEISQPVINVMDRVFNRGRACGNDEAIMECLRAEIVLLGPHLHGHRAVIICPAAIAPGLAAEPKTREDAGELGDLPVVVSWYRLAVSVQLPRAVGVQLPESNGEKLLHLARVIFVGILIDFGTG